MHACMRILCTCVHARAHDTCILAGFQEVRADGLGVILREGRGGQRNSRHDQHIGEIVRLASRRDLWFALSTYAYTVCIYASRGLRHLAPEEEEGGEEEAKKRIHISGQTLDLNERDHQGIELVRCLPFSKNLMPLIIEVAPEKQVSYTRCNGPASHLLSWTKPIVSQIGSPAPPFSLGPPPLQKYQPFPAGLLNSTLGLLLWQTPMPHLSSASKWHAASISP